ncbi:MAG TPA: long-chain fatty acid--CoA ligase [Egibacteraceae bacterium]|nr:long-chain fatty acid--CoA ligase [Egibacteraceae bacterium]
MGGSAGKEREYNVNIAESLRASAARLPDKAAVVFQDSPVTYAELDQRADRAAAAFQRMGLVPGDRVALMAANAPHFAEALYGAWRAGLVVVPVNVLFTAEEVRHILSDSEARAIVVTEAFAGALRGLREELPGLEEVVVAGGSTAEVGTRRWRDLLDEDAAPAAVDTAPDALALLQYTSGTTGQPKGAMLTHANLQANHEQMAQTQLRVEERDILLCVLPLFHIYALNVALAFTLSRGATVLLIERFDALATLQAVERHRASIIIGAPPMYVAWVNTSGVDELDLQCVRFAISGAAPLPRHVLERFQDELGITIWEGYGLSETSPVLTTVAMGEEVKPGSVGRPVPGVELRLLDDKGNEARPGDPGEVVVRGPNVFSGYWRQPEATREVLSEDGWFRTGDVGLLDGGDLYLVDRKKDLIIVSGFNVYPREVEEVLYRHPKIAEAAVIGTSHPYTGEAVKAVVVLRPGEEATADEVTDFCRRFLARFKCPEVVEFAAELPHLPSGKVLRRALRDQPQVQGTGHAEQA